MEITRLTLKQQKFVDEYINNGGNGSKAVISAGYNATTENSIRSIASENLHRRLIGQAIELNSEEVEDEEEEEVEEKSRGGGGRGGVEEMHEWGGEARRLVVEG